MVLKLVPTQDKEELAPTQDKEDKEELAVRDKFSDSFLPNKRSIIIFIL